MVSCMLSHNLQLGLDRKKHLKLPKFQLITSVKMFYISHKRSMIFFKSQFKQLIGLR
jgi:hypothetical protein